ncbi:hypothetical protein SARC_08635 [Sphaeroforma arctica JP610]|uniref:Uncharacterized protein n=1 Tax=Sphaeroforma arctica JP610 TaxID=667725 RepID=A0A0L0FQ93_9EUKA|nr:hypothetical protein SARC_08635 [Sphaeroforma arctica JP610]KNC78957.1 hypothetical protein SARC_08635 [Sphaeroforma arctica JP610]|eukprot:XP_014152859.1 hypothetical protein SARC_08635 [Sphaeroforma arctica JP610]
MLKMLFEEPRSDMLIAADRLAGEFRNSPWKVVAMSQNFQTYGMWAVMGHHLFRILAHRDAEGPMPNYLDVFLGLIRKLEMVKTMSSLLSGS